MSQRAHAHPCHFCRTPVECDGELSPNPDGEPAVICSVRHRAGGYVEAALCEACLAAQAREGER